MPDLPNGAADQAADDIPTEIDTPTGDLPVEATSDAPTEAISAVASEPVVDAVAIEPIAAVVTDHVFTEPPRRRTSIALRFGVSFVVGILLAVGIGAGVLYAWGAQYDGRVLPGVSIGSVDVGGLTRDQAEAKLADAYAWLGTGQVTLTGPDGTTTTLTYADLGRGPDTSALLDAAFAAGRDGDPLANLISAPRAALHGMTLDLAVAFDHDKVAAAVESLAASIDQAPVDATLTAGPGGTFTTTAAKEGRAVDKTGLETALEQQLEFVSVEAPSSVGLPVPVVAIAPTVATSTVETAKAAADRMSADVVITRGDDSWKIARSSLAPLISFLTATDGTISTVFDESRLDAIMTSLAKKVDRKPQDAGLRMVNGHVIATGASHEGRTLDAAGMKATVLSEIRARQAGAAATPVAAVVKAVNPKLTKADAEAFAPKMRMISSFSVYYWVIVNNHFGGNIEAPATKINGTVVPAGRTFDFWKVVGDLRRLPGTGPGNAIEGGKITVTGAFGGGICTTSTTLFNAAFRAGMVPMARKNHNEFINRYPPGLDATVWIVGNTKQTMSFKNDTKYPILITRTVTRDGNKRWLTFKIWSVPNGRTYKISNTVIQHGPRAIDTIVHDASKPVGYRYRNNAPADGAKVWVTVSIYDHGKLHWTKRYYSNYPAVNGVLVVGTKT